MTIPMQQHRTFGATPTSRPLTLRPSARYLSARNTPNASWHGDLTVLAKLVAGTDDGAFRSGVALAVGSVPVAGVTVSNKREWETMLSKWFTTERDALRTYR